MLNVFQNFYIVGHRVFVENLDHPKGQVYCFVNNDITFVWDTYVSISCPWGMYSWSDHDHTNIISSNEDCNILMAPLNWSTAARDLLDRLSEGPN